MGKLVAAFGVSHTAQMVRAFREEGLPPQIERVREAWQESRERLERAQPDVLIVISSEHLRTFFFNNYPTFCLGVGDASEGWGDGSIPAYRVPLYPEFTEFLLAEAIESGFDLSFSDDMRLDHGFMTPIHFLNPDMTRRVVPLFQNCNTTPIPTVKRCYALGNLLRQAIERWPSNDRFAVIGTGGLSHWLGVPEMGRINPEFDRAWIDLAASGRTEQLLSISSQDIRREAGNGGQELLNWVTMLGAANGATGEVLVYEPVEEWITGIGLLAMRVE